MGRKRKASDDDSIVSRADLVPDSPPAVAGRELDTEVKPRAMTAEERMLQREWDRLTGRKNG